MTYKEYVIAVDSSTDIYAGNLSSFTVLLPTTYRNIIAMQLVDLTLPGIDNVYYEFISIEGFNQLSSPSGGVNFAFAKIPLDGGNAVIVADTNTYNYAYIPLGNPIASLDRLQVSFVDIQANIIFQTAPCNFQLRLMKKEDSSIYGYGEELTPNQNITPPYKPVPRARRK
jgi:hypothetical protein